MPMMIRGGPGEAFYRVLRCYNGHEAPLRNPDDNSAIETLHRGFSLSYCGVDVNGCKRMDADQEGRSQINDFAFR
jgi:hypothetical protein